MKKYFRLLLTLMACSFFFVGCCSIDSEPYSDDEVYKELAETCEEEYTLLNIERKEEAPKEYTYYFKCNDRDLTFESKNGIILSSSENFGSYYVKRIDNTYVRDVINQYMEKVVDRMESKSYCYSSSVATKRWEDVYASQCGNVKVTLDSNYKYLVEQFLDDMEYANNLYANELQYNSEEWMRNNYLLDYDIYLKDAKGKYHFAYEKIINGVDKFDRDLERTLIINSCKNEIMSEELENIYGFDMTTIPAVITLAPCVNGEDVDYIEFNGGNYNTNEEALDATYIPVFDDYAVLLNAGAKTDANPNTLNYFINKANGKIKKATKRYTEFTIGEDTYTVEAVYEQVLNREEFTKFEVTKNGEKYDLPYDRGATNYAYLVYVPVKDLAEIFNFDYTYDLENEKWNLNFK